MPRFNNIWLLTAGAVILLAKLGPGAYGLKATLGSYWDVPKTTKEAAAQGWEMDDPEKGCYNFGKYEGHRWVEKHNVGVGLLFNWHGNLCGVQMLTDYKIFEGDNDYRFDLEPMYQISSVGRKLYWTLTAYFCHPSIICNNETSTGDDHSRFAQTLYYQFGPTPNDRYLREVPYKRSDAIKEGWSAENCFDGMGYHNLWDVSEFKKYSCSRFIPALLVFDNHGNRQGFGFWAMGQVPNTSSRLEKPPGRVIEAIMGRDAPPCILTRGTTSLHFFSINDPANFHCHPETPHI